jgi:hypothetical protein
MPRIPAGLIRWGKLASIASWQNAAQIVNPRSASAAKHAPGVSLSDDLESSNHPVYRLASRPFAGSIGSRVSRVH